MAQTSMTNYRQFILARFNDEQMPIGDSGPGQLPRRRANATNGSPIPGDAYQRIKPIINRIADDGIRRDLLGNIAMMSKFQFLQMITEPTNPLMKNDPDVALAIVDAAIATEYAADGSVHGGLHKF